MDGNDLSEPGPRDVVLQRLAEDLTGPRKDDELLTSRPSDIYLTGILWPRNTPVAPEEDESLSAEGTGGNDAEEAIDAVRPASAGMRRPSAAGLSFAARGRTGEAPSLWVKIRFGLYADEERDSGGTSWRRTQHEYEAPIVLTPGLPEPRLPEDAPAGVRLNVRAVPGPDGVIATVTLINGATPDQEGRAAMERATLFQVSLEIRAQSGSALISRPSRRAAVDEDDHSAALLYRNAREYAAGHTCSAEWPDSVDDTVEFVRTTWIPAVVSPAVDAAGHQVFHALSTGDSSPLSAAWLTGAPDDELIAGLIRVCDAYGEWVELQEAAAAPLVGPEHETALRHLLAVRSVLKRMRDGVDRLKRDPHARRSFRLANRAMLLQRVWAGQDPLRWRPFQVGFLLLTLESAIDGNHPDREVMDLLWFPTGGGKTEAYLGLIAIVLFHRRLVRIGKPDEGAGVAAIMRYTLRLLTTQQFQRAAAMICACEAIRRGRVEDASAQDLGNEPFSIGLWVGDGATPNRRSDAYLSRSDPTKVSPRQLSNCPCCHSRLEYQQANGDAPVLVVCAMRDCMLSDANLPVWTVDEDVYAARPSLVIGTADKFAQIVRKKDTAALFAVGSGAQPQLILQDELHLIAGPLGTLAGLYEAALDLILSADGARPKIIGSTATIRRASEQVGALFDRSTCQFPPPALDAQDTGFAVPDPGAPGRLYVGVTTAGRSAKFTLQAVSASLLQTGVGGLSPAERDPYFTLVTYFNALRELGGALVLMQDDVADGIALVAQARGEAPRRSAAIEELTSRRSQSEIIEMLARLELPAGAAGALDAVLATNMLSVGVDIPRLGLMLVNGQPKTMAEYIQATSRVGRGRHQGRPIGGLVVALLNNGKPRDRSHYETFGTWHSTLYRNVEATSVTPFASRARDRALHAVLVAVVRHLAPGMIDSPVLSDAAYAAACMLIDKLVERAHRIDEAEGDVELELRRWLDRWRRRAPKFYWDRKPRDSLLQGAERAAANRAAGREIGAAWPTPNTLRGVEASTPFRIAERLRIRDDAQ